MIWIYAFSALGKWALTGGGGGYGVADRLGAS